MFQLRKCLCVRVYKLRGLVVRFINKKFGYVGLEKKVQ